MSYPPEFRSNVSFWQQLQEQDYFELHPLYGGLRDDLAGDTHLLIERLTPLASDAKVVVIGCGYGRETVDLAQRVAHIWGIDVSKKILEKASCYLRERGIINFTPVLAEAYDREIPQGIDLVFSCAVMQHLTRDLVNDYFAKLAEKLSPSGAFVVQFLETASGCGEDDAELKLYEPSVTWSVWDIVKLCQANNLALKEVRTNWVNPTSLWHWVNITRAAI